MARRVAVVVFALVGCLLFDGAASPTPGSASEPNDRPFLGQSESAAEAVATAAVVPAGFSDEVAIAGLTNPTVVQFAADGRVFVGEKSGLIKVFDNLTDTTPTTFADLRPAVHNFWDRGLLGLALPPTFPTSPYVYVLYAYDALIGGTGPLWNDACPNPPGATTDGCVISARLSRLQASGNVMIGPEQVLINDWCQQYPSHSIGSLAFGPDGALYLSAGDGASFSFADYGQGGGSPGSPTPRNPCGDAPVPVGGVQTPPTAEGGSLRSQDLRTMPGGGTSYAATVLADGPVAYWRLGEASGSVANDEVGSLDGTYSPAGVTRGLGGALNGDANTAVLFNPAAGGNVAVTANGTALNRGDGPLTIEAWVKKTNHNVDYGIVSRGQGGYYLRIASNNTLNFLRSQTADIVHSTVTITDTAWHHVAATKNGASVKLYIDGVDVTGPVSNSTLVNPTDTFHIGSDTGVNEVIDGSVDEVAIYPTVLSASQLAAHYQAGITGGGGAADPVTLDGAVLRLDPTTGAAMAGNPLIASPDLNARRIVATGLRNPFRMTFRPGTSELWLGDVGWGNWEELNLIATPTSGPANFGWPCYEGNGRQASYDGLNVSICENLYAAGAGAIASPYFTYSHQSKVVPNETCPTSNGSSVAGLAFYTTGSYPVSFQGGLFFADYSRDCIWFMPKLANGRPNTAQASTFVAGAANPVYLTIGPAGDLFYADFDAGTIHRVRFTAGNQPPTAVIAAAPTSGSAPLAVAFNGTGSTDPEGGPLTYAWDFDGNGTDDATTATANHTYTVGGTYLARLRVTDPGTLSDTETVTITVNNTPPVPVIDLPASSFTWAVGDTVNFAGHATDAEDGTEPASRLSWTVTMHHCPINPNDCHPHAVQTFPGVASGSFAAPDHEYPSYLEIVLTATDAGGLQATTSVRIDPKTVSLSFASVPSGLQLTIGSFTGTTPFTRVVITNSQNSITAPSPQSLGGQGYVWQTWSDGGAQSHNVIASTSATYTATYQPGGGTSYAATVLADGPVAYWRLGEASGSVANDEVGSLDGTYSPAGVTRGLGGALNGDANTAVLFNPAAGGNVAVTANGTALNRGDGPLTIEAWVKKTNHNVDYGIVSRGQGGYYLRIASNNTLNFLRSQTADIVHSTVTITDTAWHHVAATKNGASVKLYIDGVDVTGPVSNSTLVNPTDTFHIGSDTGVNEVIDGSVDEVAIYPTVLSASQLAAHYQAGITGGGAFAQALSIEDEAITAPISSALPAITERRPGIRRLGATRGERWRRHRS